MGSDVVMPTFIEEVVERLKEGKIIRRKLATGGALNIDKAMPYLLVYRIPDHKDNGTIKLIQGESSYLIADSKKNTHTSLSKLVKAIGQALYEKFKGFFLIEIWAEETDKNKPVFHLKAPPIIGKNVINTFADNLSNLSSLVPGLKVSIDFEKQRHPEGMKNLLSVKEAKEIGCLEIGIGIPPVYRNKLTQKIYPVFLRNFSSELSEILKQAIYDFVRIHTTCDIVSHKMVGSSYLKNITKTVDAQLTEISKSFSLLMLITPIHTSKTWKEFSKNKFQKEPHFFYRLLPVDPEALKKQLYQIPVEDIYDPILASIYRGKRDELDKEITLLQERGTASFMYTGLRLYGPVTKELLDLAEGLLVTLPNNVEDTDREMIDCHQFRDMAEKELTAYKKELPNIKYKIQIREDVNSLMVAGSNLYIGKNTSIPKKRAQALIQHEVGTHMLTYFNGKEQPLQVLHHGLANYDQLQEGMAVMAEYLSGGLNFSRMRLLAGRVIAVDRMTRGDKFSETFLYLKEKYNFSEKTSFDVTTRVYRGGGFVKDAIYLRGLAQLLEYLRNGGDYNILLTGKISEEHISIIDELVYRGMLKKPVLIPRYLKNEKAIKRLESIKNGLLITDLGKPNK